MSFRVFVNQTGNPLKSPCSHDHMIYEFLAVVIASQAFQKSECCGITLNKRQLPLYGLQSGRDFFHVIFGKMGFMFYQAFDLFLVNARSFCFRKPIRSSTVSKVAVFIRQPAGIYDPIDIFLFLTSTKETRPLTDSDSYVQESLLFLFQQPIRSGRSDKVSSFVALIFRLQSYTTTIFVNFITQVITQVINHVIPFTFRYKLLFHCFHLLFPEPFAPFA